MLKLGVLAVKLSILTCVALFVGEVVHRRIRDATATAVPALNAQGYLIDTRGDGTFVFRVYGNGGYQDYELRCNQLRVQVLDDRAVLVRPAETGTPGHIEEPGRPTYRPSDPANIQREGEGR